MIRVSGKSLDAFIQAFFGRTLRPRYAHFLPFNDAEGELIDEGIALYFPGPHSYTGQDVLELQGHGGTAVLKALLMRVLEVGEMFQMRLAEPGEFTQRAFLNGRMDLVQAEAVADLIDATHANAAKSAAAALQGRFSEAVNKLADRIIHLRMLVEATLDFPEEEIDFLEHYQVPGMMAEIQGDLTRLLAQSEQGLALRDGVKVVLVGEPNVGKSSLLNALAGDSVAIVTPIAGTTRDKVVQDIYLGGVPLHIVDTAGLRDAKDEVERIGIERTWQAINDANIVLHLSDCTATPEDPQLLTRILAHVPPHTPVVSVVNKIDLAEGAAALGLNVASDLSEDAFFISARTGEGLEELAEKILSLAGYQAQQETPWLARQRHLQALQSCQSHLTAAEAHAAQGDAQLELFAQELREAHDALGYLTGRMHSDDLLGEIFGHFCIGK